MPNEILRLPQVRQRVGLSRSSIYNLLSEGEFPRPVRLGARSVGWLQNDIESWLADRIAIRDADSKEKQVQSATGKQNK